MSADSNVAPIIIKRKKVVQSGGHHGGAWKVAYADFVTAMMAFFMLMWLLNATTDKQRKGIADYFSPTIAISRVSGGGDGALGGETVFSQNELTRMGTGSTNLRAEPTPRAEKAQATKDNEDRTNEAAEAAVFESIEDRLTGKSGESMVEDNILRHVISEVTDEGLVITFRETVDQRLFDADGMPTDILQALIVRLAEVSTAVTNPVAIEAHTASFPLVLAKDPGWDVSNQRANQFRRMLTEEGFDSYRISRVTAHADREPTVKNTMDVRNNRIDIIFLRTP